MAFSRNWRFSRRLDADPVADVPLSMAENKSDPEINHFIDYFDLGLYALGIRRDLIKIQ